jgi:hypothetical protein
MPRVTIDFSDAVSRKPIPDDTYPVKIAEFTGPHKGPKAPYLTAVLEITEGDHAGRKFFHNMPIAGAGAGMFADFLSKATGQEVNVDDLDKIDVDTDDLVGVELASVIKQEEYPEGSGEFSSKISKILKAK